MRTPGSVRVPDLSKNRCRVWASASMMRGVRLMTPFSDSLQIPDHTASGVAMPSAHGQATRSTDMAVIQPFKGEDRIPHETPETRAASATHITKCRIQFVARIWWVDSVLRAAASTSCMIWSMILELCGSSGRIRRLASTDHVPAETRSPCPLRTGSGSPVMGVSFMYPKPSSMMPSTAMDPPGFTMTLSPVASSETLTDRVVPSPETRMTRSKEARSLSISAKARSRETAPSLPPKV